MKPEDKLQFDIVVWFSQTFPEYYGSMWAVFNEDSKHKKALGLHSGASDLQFFIKGIFLCIEVKAVNSVHNSKHIKRQIEWGENIISNSGYYYIGSNIDKIKQNIYDCIRGIAPIHTGLEIVYAQIDKKTIKF